MNFLEIIFERLRRDGEEPVLQEIRDGKIDSVSGREFLALIQTAREFLRQAGLHKRDRCALLAPNSIRWAALDLALMAEGVVVIPLYARQAPAELAGMIKDGSPSLVCCGDEILLDAVKNHLSEATPLVTLETVFANISASSGNRALENPTPLAGDDPVTIIYTSGTSGEPKGVVLIVRNLNHMLPCTNDRLDRLMGPRQEPDRVFHYLPLNFAGSWIILLTCLSRHSVVALSTDLTKLGDELKLAAPNYFLNVPTLLERVRAKIEDQIKQRSSMAASLFDKARKAGLRLHHEEAKPMDPIWIAVANAFMFPSIRKSLGPNLKALICGSAPLAIETQLFYAMLGVPVLQGYGLTETTALCTLDDPHAVEPGRVGLAIPEVQMLLGENQEILVRGPNVFSGYWNKPEATARVLQDGWFHTGDQGEVNAAGNWRIIGRLKELIILNSGHNIAPEPIEDKLLRSLPRAQQVMLYGDDRSYLVALVSVAASNALTREQVETAVAQANAGLPHYKQIRNFYFGPNLFTIENGLLTANGKLKRSMIAAHFHEAIEDMYRKPQS
jgi:long-chain acyl-CoA synthetase